MRVFSRELVYGKAMFRLRVSSLVLGVCFVFWGQRSCCFPATPWFPHGLEAKDIVLCSDTLCLYHGLSAPRPRCGRAQAAPPL